MKKHQFSSTSSPSIIVEHVKAPAFPTKQIPGGTMISHSQTESLHILVVDDNVDSADTTALLLSCAGYEACATYDGYTAVELAASGSFDAVVLDLGMPIVDGFEVAAELTRLPQAPALIAYSAWDDRETRERTFSVGFDSHIAKPAQLETLVRELERASAIRRSRVESDS